MKCVICGEPKNKHQGTNLLCVSVDYAGGQSYTPPYHRHNPYGSSTLDMERPGLRGRRVLRHQSLDEIERNMR